MKYIVASIILILLITKANAIEVPFINGNSRSHIEFPDTTYEGLLRPMLETLLQNSHQDRKAAHIDVNANKAARLDKEAIAKMLRSEGFYMAKISHEIHKDDIHFTVNPGQPYVIADVFIESHLEPLPPAQEFGLEKGKRFRAAEVLSAQAGLKKYIENNRCLWEIKVTYDATVNHPSKEATITLTVGDSEKVTFGSVAFEGLTTVDEQYLKSKLGFKEGTCFKRPDVERARLNLFQTNLLSGVESSLEKHDTQADVVFYVTERKHKTIKAGAGVSSDEGASLSTGWENRNFLGKAEKLEVNAKLSELFRRADTSLTIPSFLNAKQNLILKGEVSEENLEAFDAKSVSTSVTLQRKLGQYLTGSVGARLDVTRVEDNDKNETFGLASFPTGLDYDKRDNVLDPKSGWLVSGEVTPFVDTLDTSVGFVKSSVGASAYYSAQNAIFKPTFALRGATGSINGLNTNDIPADERFYAGGGGSVRGYPFQKLGPLEADDPTGGRSFSELSFETRTRFSDSWGGVIFLDGGNAYDDITPDFSEGLKWAYGAGIRYYTDFAPIRLDVAIPLERRVGIDDSFQFYISIGQAF